MPRNSVIPPHDEYAIFLRIRIATYRHKLHYEDLGSQRWYFQPLRYSILQGTLLYHGHIYVVLSGIMGLADVIDRIRRHTSQTGEAYLAANDFTARETSNRSVGRVD